MIKLRLTESSEFTKL